MSSSDLPYLRHMLDEARYLEGRSAGLDAARLQQDATFQRAFVRSLEIIGEAAKHVSVPFRDRYPAVAWRAWRGCATG